MVYLTPSWAADEAPDDYMREPPDLAVEVRSTDQPWKQLLEKVTEYLKLGVRLVWVIDPSTLRVHVFRPDEEPQVLAAENDFYGGANICPDSVEGSPKFSRFDQAAL